MALYHIKFETQVSNVNVEERGFYKLQDDGRGLDKNVSQFYVRFRVRQISTPIP
jgi:hypothetical protein